MNLNIFHWRSLKTRVTLFTLVIFLIGIWSLALYASRMLREDMQRLLGDQQFSTVSFMAAELNHELDDRLGALKNVAVSVTPLMLGNTAALKAFLEQRQELLNEFNGGVVAYRLDGSAIAEVPRSTGQLGVSHIDADALVALKDSKSTIGRPVMGRTLGAPMFDMAVPIRDVHGRMIGALVGVTNLGLSSFLDVVSENSQGKTGGYLLIAPQYRQVVTSTGRKRIMEALPSPGINQSVDRLIQGDEGSAVMVNQLGIEVLTSDKGVPAAGWVMSAVLPTEEAFAPIRDTQRRMLLATLFVSLLAGGLTWWMLGLQLLPMLAAVRTLAKLSDAGQPPQPLPITGQDEIGKLIGGFNRVLETLREREEALKESEERYRAVVE